MNNVYIVKFARGEQLTQADSVEYAVAAVDAVAAIGKATHHLKLQLTGSADLTYWRCVKCHEHVWGIVE